MERCIVVRVEYLGYDFVRRVEDALYDPEGDPFTFLFGIGGVLWWIYCIFGWPLCVIPIGFMFYAYGRGMVIWIGRQRYHAITVAFALIGLFEALTGIGNFKGVWVRYVSAPEVIISCPPLILFHLLAFVVIFVFTLLLSFKSDLGLGILVIMPLHVMLGVMCVAWGVHLMWLPFFYFVPMLLVDYLHADDYPNSIVGGAGFLDALVLVPGMVFSGVRLYFSAFRQFVPYGGIPIVDRILDEIVHGMIEGQMSYLRPLF